MVLNLQAEEVPTTQAIKDAVFRIREGQEISHSDIIKTLSANGFEKVDFVSAPGQYAIRGSIVDIFSFSENYPFRISFWGNEIETIHSFDCNTQLSRDKVSAAEIISNVVGGGEVQGQPLSDLFPKDSLLWLDSSDMYFREALKGDAAAALALARELGFVRDNPDGTLKVLREGAELAAKLPALGLSAPW